MAKKVSRPAKAASAGKAKAVTESGATGGPSTGHGVSYQIQYSILRALEMISRQLAIPTKHYSILIEPRATDAGGGVTRWDIGELPSKNFNEAKLNPTRKEIEEWLDHVRATGASCAERSFGLVYSKGSGPLLTSVGHLIRCAREANKDQQKFQELIKIEAIQDADAVLARLGAAACDLLTRSSLFSMPEASLQQQIELSARMMAGEASGQRLREFLFKKFHDGMWTRSTFEIGEIVKEIEGLGVQLQAPPDIHDSELSPAAAAAIHALQSCPQRLPISVVAASASLPASELHQHLQRLIDNGVLEISAEHFSIKPLVRALTCTNRDVILGQALEALLDFIRAHKHDDLGREQIGNAVALLRLCATSRPTSVLRAFDVLDKLLKGLGDKHLVLEVAELCIAAARRALPRNHDAVKCEVKALICGKSWVYQRINRLADAHAAAELSLERGKDIGWDRNTAFCRKCCGRLYRIEAENTQDAAERASLLGKSERSLFDAIELFEKASDPDLGENCPEVGDCHSLLGRTYLAGDRLAEANAAARTASQIIIDRSSKDYMDLAILLGDLAVKTSDRDAAERFYTEVIDLPRGSNAERSEILARAYLARGRNRATLRQGSASLDFKEAEKIWKSLDEQEWAATAQWESIRLTAALPPGTIQMLAHERPAVRVAAYTANEGQVARMTGGRQRSDPGMQYWARLIREAKERVATEGVNW